MDVFLKKMRNIKIEDAICVKITIYKDYHADEVIYYRNKLPARIVSKWRWYFEYVAARVKVSNPRRKVELFIGPQTLLQGQEYIDARRATLLQAKKSKMKQLQNTPINDDLFSFGRQEQDRKIQNVQGEIDALERGEFNYYVPPEYINVVKKWITHKTNKI